MLRTLCTVALACAIAAGSGAALAQVPLDPTGEITGYVPPSKGVLKCERYMNKRAHLASLCVTKCNAKMIDYIWKNLPFDDTVCENTGPSSCLAKYTRSLGGLGTGLCPPCMDAPAQAALATEYMDWANTINGAVYCAPGTPLDPPNTGNVPAQIDHFKCANRFGRNVQKLIKCIGIKCHRALADDLFNGAPAFNVFDCEIEDPVNSCKARYELDNTKLTGCPPCLDAAARDVVFQNVRNALNTRNGQQYCGF